MYRDGLVFFFFFKQKTAYEIYQCDWSSDVCSSDLMARNAGTLAIGVAWGYHPASELRDAGADDVIVDFDELAAVLEHLVGN